MATYKAVMICMTKHSHSSYTSTYRSTPYNLNRKPNILHIPFTNTQHTSTLQGLNTIFNNARYTTNIPTIIPHSHYNRHKNKHAPYTHIYCLYVSSHTRQYKILRTSPPHISGPAEILPHFSRRTHVQLRTNKSPFLKSYLHKVAPNHIHHHYAPSVTLTHTTHIMSTTAPSYTPRCHLWIWG